MSVSRLSSLIEIASIQNRMWYVVSDGNLLFDIFDIINRKRVTWIGSKKRTWHLTAINNQKKTERLFCAVRDGDCCVIEFSGRDLRFIGKVRDAVDIWFDHWHMESYVMWSLMYNFFFLSHIHFNFSFIHTQKKHYSLRSWKEVDIFAKKKNDFPLFIFIYLFSVVKMYRFLLS